MLMDLTINLLLISLPFLLVLALLIMWNNEKPGK